MKKIVNVIIFCLLVVITCSFVQPVHAQQKTKDPVSTEKTGDFVPKKTGQTSDTGFDLDVRLKNPLKVNTITDAITLFVNLVLKIALPFVIIMFIWSGLKFILAQGNATKIGDAKKLFWGTVIGTLLILGAWTITNAIIGTVNSLGTNTTQK